MRQAIALVVGLALLAVAAVLVPAEEATPPDPVAPEYPGTATDLALCPTWNADETVTSFLALGVVDEFSATAAFQADDETLMVDVARSTAGVATADPGLAQGYVPVLVESTGPTPVAAGVMTTASGIAAASGCARWTSTRWTVGVGGTLQDEETILLLHNPTAQVVTVRVEVYSEQGLEIGEGFGAVTVPPGLLEVEVTGDLRLRERLVFVVDDPVGAVVPALDHRPADFADRGVTTGVPESPEWYFPTTGGVPAELVLVNAGTVEVAVEVDLFADTVDVGAEAFLLPARSIEVVALEAGTAVRVRSDAPVGAAVRAERPGGVGLTMGLAAEAESWFVPGVGRDRGERTLALLNTGTDTVDVTYRVVGPGGAAPARTIQVPPGSVVRQDLEITNAAGVELEASAPISVGWTSIAAGPIAVDQGVPRG